MENRKITKEEKKAWEKCYAKDLRVVGGFAKQEPGKSYRLYFEDGTQFVAYFMGCDDSDNGLDLNDPYYEDLLEFDFRVKKIEQKGSELNYKVEEWITLNYHNFFINFEKLENEI